jgi:DNA end-binding protein Ku
VARPIWKGSISFGLVTIPVDLLPADASKDIALHLLDKRDFAPVGYERINKETGEKVAWSDVVRGYQHAKGEYVVLTDEELAAANTEKTQTIDLLAFVEAEEVDPMLFDRPYWLVPSGKTKGGAKAYALLRETLAKTGKVGVGNIVLRTRAHLAALVPKKQALALVILRYADELRPEADLELPPADAKKAGITARELDLAEKLVDGLVEKWDPKKYRDDYREDVLALIEKKVEHGEVNSLATEKGHAKKKPETKKVVDLMELLKKSVAKGSAKKPIAKTRPKTAAGHGHPRTKKSA